MQIVKFFFFSSFISYVIYYFIYYRQDCLKFVERIDGTHLYFLLAGFLLSSLFSSTVVGFISKGFTNGLLQMFVFWGTDTVYEEIEHSVLNLDSNYPLWFNFGYWKDANNFVEAAQNMAQLIADKANFQVHHRVADVGFGCGDASFYWIKKYNVEHITGFNNSVNQVTIALNRAREQNLTHKINFLHSSASEISTKCEPNSLHKVCCLDSAYHFLPSREYFLREAFKVLKPGGQLILVDLSFYNVDGSTLHKTVPLWVTACLRLLSIGADVPMKNMYNTYEYGRKLQSIGYSGVTMTILEEENVFPSFSRFLEQRQREMSSFVKPDVFFKLKFVVWLMNKLTSWVGIDVVLISAYKPK